MLLSDCTRSPAIRVDRVGLVRVEDRGKLTAYALIERPQPMLTEWTPS